MKKTFSNSISSKDAFFKEPIEKKLCWRFWNIVIKKIIKIFEEKKIFPEKLENCCCE
jgi:hypothetical protein